MCIYRTYFSLTACVLNVDNAQKYLSEYNMKDLIKTYSMPEHIKNTIDSINWVLVDNSSGYVELKTNIQLSNEELKFISKFVLYQNSNGLAKDFSQQDFANYEDEGLTGYEGDDWDDEYIMASFDWQSNEYIFNLVTTE